MCYLNGYLNQKIKKQVLFYIKFIVIYDNMVT